MCKISNIFTIKVSVWKNLLALAHVDVNSLWRQWIIAWVETTHACIYKSSLLHEKRSSWPKNNQINLPSSFCYKKRRKGNLGFVHSFELRIFLKSWDLKHYCDCNNKSFKVHIDLQQWTHTPKLNFVEC
jgi:hypothetical protein